jgi:hypothetical protein
MSTELDNVVDQALRLVLAADEAGAAELDAELEAERVAIDGNVRAARVRVRWQRGTDAVVDELENGSPEAAQSVEEARERLPWDHYAPELRDALKDLAATYPADTLVDAAHRLAELIAEHGADALAARRAARQEVAR